MRTALLPFALAVAFAAVAAGARADGIVTSPGAETGWGGVLASGGKLRYVAIPGRRETTVAVVSVRGGRVLRWGAIRGSFGVPLVAYDGTTGGLTGDGKTVVLATPTSNPAGVSRFPIVATKTLRVRSIVALRGSWSFDAVSPNASTLFLVQYLDTGPNARYRVRAFDLKANRLIPGAIVDRLEEEAVMRGQPATRATSSDGMWAYTLYARQKHEPFVHALDTVRREAFCIDLPLRLPQPKQMELRLKLAGGGRSLSIRFEGKALASIDTRSFAVRRS